MAISKPITGSNGVITTYHRIYTILTNINNEILIEITSYLNKEGREEEKYYENNFEKLNKEYEEKFIANWAKVSSIQELPDLLPQTSFQGYTSTRTVCVPYEEEFDVVKAYEWLTENDELLQGGEEI